MRISSPGRYSLDQLAAITATLGWPADNRPAAASYGEPGRLVAVLDQAGQAGLSAASRVKCATTPASPGLV